MIQTGTEKFMQHFSEELVYGDSKHAISAARILYKYADESTVPYLLEALKRKEEIVLGYVIKTLARLKAKEAILPLAEKLKDENEQIKHLAASALEELCAFVGEEEKKFVKELMEEFWAGYKKRENLTEQKKEEKKQHSKLRNIVVYSSLALLLASNIFLFFKYCGMKKDMKRK